MNTTTKAIAVMPKTGKITRLMTFKMNQLEEKNIHTGHE